MYLERNEYMKGFSDVGWCKFALNNDCWKHYEHHYISLDSSEDFRSVASLIENMEGDGWKYEDYSSDNGCLSFSKDIPVTEDERKRASEWLDKYMEVGGV